MKNIRTIIIWPVFHRAGVIEVNGIRWATGRPESGSEAGIARRALEALVDCPYAAVIDNPGEVGCFEGKRTIDTLTREFAVSGPA